MSERVSDPREALHVTFVCSGNICRSPMAEVVLRDRLVSAGLGDAVVVDSAGISNEEHGNPMDGRAIRVLRERGYDDVARDAHRARPVTATDLRSRDLVLAMTSVHAVALRRLAGTAHDRVRLYRSFDREAPQVGPGDAERLLDLDDPWYGGRAEFEDCLDQIEAAADELVAYVRTALGCDS